MQSSGLTTLDIAIVLAYLVLVIWRGLRSSTKNKGTDDFFLASRSLSWPLIGLSLYASNMSSSSIVGLASSGYETGISVFNYEWIGTVTLVIFSIFIVPYYLHYRLFTMPEFLERRYDARSRYYYAGITILANIIIDTAGALYAASVVMKIVWPGISINLFIFAIALLSGLYTISGGLKAVVFTDSIQAILLTLGSVIITVALFWHVGSWDTITSRLSNNMLSLVQPADDEFIPWPTLIISLPILGFYFWCTNQYMVQRILGARSVEDGRKGALFAGLLKLPLLFIMVLPGTVAHLIYPSASQPNLVYPRLMFDLLPSGVLGIVLTGFIAALMSSMDSGLNAASTQATMDFYKKFKPESSERHLILVGRLFTLLFVILASTWAPFIDQFPTLWEYLQAALSYLIPPVVACFAMGLFWKKASSDGAFLALILGNLLGLFILVNNHLNWFHDIHYLYAATIIFVFCLVVIWITSLLRPDPAKEQQMPLSVLQVMRREDQLIAGSPWYQSSRFYSIIVLAITSLIVITFW